MKKIIIAVLVICAAALVWYGVKSYMNNAKYNQAGFAYGNGRLEATEVSVATKLSGKISDIYADEGDLVKKGDKLALMQLNVLNAELEQAKAKLLQSQAQLEQAKAQVGVKESEVSAAQARAEQKKSTLDGALKRYNRAKQLKTTGSISDQLFENDETHYLTSKADLSAAQADVKQSQAELKAAQAAVKAAEADIRSSQAQVARVQADIDDSTLVSPARGRIQYRVAQVGEVLNSGSSVLNLVDLTDVYMTFFLPEEIAGRVKIGADARIVLDAIPETPIPAKISFVADVAQFTPKTVETREERQKLMFRVKAKIDPALLEQYIQYIKTGIPGEAWVKINPEAKWPDFLTLKREREQQTK